MATPLSLPTPPPGKRLTSLSTPSAAPTTPAASATPARPPAAPPPDTAAGALWQREDVRAAVAEAQEALARLRFHEGLRRGWAQARAETAVREAAALARMEGVRIDADDLRELTMRDAPGDAVDGDAARAATVDPGRMLALGIWRAQWHLASEFAPLNARVPAPRPSRPLPAMVAGLHRDVCSVLVASGRVPERAVALPADPARLRRVLALAASELPAPLAVAAVLAEFRAADVFSPGSLAVGGAVARWMLVERGVDPTGVAVISLADAENPSGAGRALGGWMSGDEGGAAAWVVRVARGLARGAREGEDVALHVQAGRLS